MVSRSLFRFYAGLALRLLSARCVPVAVVLIAVVLVGSGRSGVCFQGAGPWAAA